MTHDIPDMPLGEYLRVLRTERDEAQREVAQKVGLDQTILSRIESGQRLPTTAQVRGLATHFGLDTAVVEERLHSQRRQRRLASGSSALKDAAPLLQGTAWSRALETGVDPTASRIDAVRPSHFSSRLQRGSGPGPLPAKATTGRDDQLWDLENSGSHAMQAVRALGESLLSDDAIVGDRAREILMRLRRLLDETL